MKILPKYLAVNILHMIGLVLLGLLGMEVLILFMTQLTNIGTGKYGITAAFVYVLLNIPAQLYSLFPMAGLIGVLLGLGMLAGHSELIVMRAAGMSVAQIAYHVMLMVFTLVIVVTIVGETAAPIAVRHANSYKQFKMTGGQTLQTHQGIWVRDGNNFLQIEAILSSHTLTGVNRYEFDAGHHLVAASYAEQLNYTHAHWIASKVKVTNFQGDKTESYTIPMLPWPINLEPNVLKNATLEPDAMNLHQLYNTVRYHRSSETRANNYEFSLWKRLLQPFTSCVMMFLAIPFIMGPLRGSNLGFKLLTGIIVSFIFYFLNQFFGPLSVVLQLPPFFAALFPTLLFFVLGIALLRRVY